LEQRVLITIKKLWEKSDRWLHLPVVLGVSGGLDSIALMHIMHALAPHLGLTLHVATLDHMLRGEESAADAAFVVEEAEKLGLPCTRGKRDVKALAKRQAAGIEAAARTARYDFLADTVVALGGVLVITAHHQDDQVETILMRLIEGASLQSLVGIDAVRMLRLPPNAMVALMRPLLAVTRQQLAAYAQEKQLVWREDSTNEDRRYKRNRIRHELLPLLRQYNPRIDEALARLAEAAAVEEGYFRHLPEGLGVMVEPSRQFVIDRQRFRALHPALQRRNVRHLVHLFREQFHDTWLPRRTLTHQHILRSVDLITSGQVGKWLPLPGKLRLRVTYDTAWLESDGSSPQAETHTLLSTPSFVFLLRNIMTTPAGCSWSIVVKTGSEEQVEGVARLLVRKLAAPVLRGRREGERFAPPGLGGHKQKIKQWMIDRKVPAEVRDCVPLLDVDGQIAAIYWDEKWTVADPFLPKRPPADDEEVITVILNV
jgi:tRNA(Ile)-lysidine synthase